MSGIPREILKWLQSLDLTYSVKNPKRDFSSGYVFAEIFNRQYPQAVQMHSFDNSTQLDRKKRNWEHLERFFRKYDIQITEKDWDPVMHSAPNAALNMLKKVYGILTNREVPTAPAVDRPDTPFYARPTASHKLKDYQLQRVHDQKTRTSLANKVIDDHYERVRNEATIPGRLAESKMNSATVSKFRSSQSGTKNNSGTSREPEIRQVNVKSIDKNFRTAQSLAFIKNSDNAPKDSVKKSAKASPESFGYVKPVLELLSEMIIEVLAQNQFKSIRVEEFKEIEHGEELTRTFFNRLKDFEESFVKACFMNISRRANSVAELLIKSAIEYKNFAETVVEIISNNNVRKPYFREFVTAMSAIGESLCKLEVYTSENLFIDFLIEDLAKILIEQPSKRQPIMEIVRAFSEIEYGSRFNIVNKLHEVLKDYSELVLSISYLLKQDMQYKEELHDYYLYYANLGLKHSSSHVRAASAYILMNLVNLKPELIKDIAHKFVEAQYDKWWEVRAITLSFAGKVLASISLLDSEADEIVEPMSDIVRNLLTFKESKNVILAGMVNLAEATKHHVWICDLFVECLLEQPEEMRRKILTIEDINHEERLVDGIYALKHRTRGSPLKWNVIGMGLSLANYIQQRNFETLDPADIEVLQACLLAAPNDEAWVGIFEILKNYFFVGLCDPNICQGCIAILKKFMTAETILTSILEKSKEILTKSLYLLLTDNKSSVCRENVYEFIKYLYWSTNSVELQDFIYAGLKKFAEKYYEVFDSSYLVEIMNDIIGQRRGEIFASERGESPGTSFTKSR